MGDGVVTGYGTIDGRLVYVFAQDFTVFGGTPERDARREDLPGHGPGPGERRARDRPERLRRRAHPGRRRLSLGGYAEIFLRNTLASGVVPQISAIMGPCAGGAVYSPAITDFIFMVEGTSHMFVTGPDVIKTVTNEEVTFEELGGAQTHNTQERRRPLRGEQRAGVPAHRQEAAALPAPEQPGGPAAAPTCRRSATAGRDRLNDIVPENPNKPYDMKEVIRAVVDDGEFFEVQPDYRAATSWSASPGWTAAASASWPTSPRSWPGCWTSTASLKGARFVRFCDAFNIPLVTFEDVPGFLPGTDQEYGGIIKHGAKLLYAYCEATVPKLTVITRKAYGGAYDVMSSKHIRARLQLRLAHGRDRGDGPRGRGEHHLPQGDRGRRRTRTGARRQLIDEYREQVRQSLRRRRAWATSTTSSSPGRRGPG